MNDVKSEFARRKERWETLGYQERDIFEAFLSLDPPQRKVVREVILAFAKAYPSKTTHQHEA
jgi:hypothetical protein